MRIPPIAGIALMIIGIIVPFVPFTGPFSAWSAVDLLRLCSSPLGGSDSCGIGAGAIIITVVLVIGGFIVLIKARRSGGL